MSRTHVIDDYENLEYLEHFKKKLDKQLIQLCADIESIQERIDVARSVKMVHHGVPISIYRFGTSMDLSEATKDWVQRSAYIYRNANNPKFYGLEVSVYDKSGNKKTAHCGYKWATKKSAMLAGLDWIVNEIMPLYNGKEQQRSL